MGNVHCVEQCAARSVSFQITNISAVEQEDGLSLRRNRCPSMKD